MPRAASSRLLRIHRRALLAALEGAGGDVQRAARALGILPEHIRALIDQGKATGDPHVSGMRRRISSPVVFDTDLAEGIDDDDFDDGEGAASE